MKILTGGNLLEKVKELEGSPLSKVLTECGYTFRGKNNIGLLIHINSCHIYNHHQI